MRAQAQGTRHEARGTDLPRRDFIKLTVGAGAGLIIGFHFGNFDLDAATASVFKPNAFVRIGTDEIVTVIVNHSEMGQGVYTSLPMLLAEELDADWTKVRYEAAPVDLVYNHPAFGIQMTGGSSSTWSGFEQFRKAGAAARAMLVAAAAQRWNVDTAICRTENGHVISGSQRLSYGQLAEAAAKLTPPKEVPLKDQKDFKLIGTPTKRLDTAEKTNGSAIFGIDVKQPNMLTAVVAHPPVFGGKMKSVDDAKARAVPGVRKIVQVPSGVAVLADGFWPAKKGRDALQIEWDLGPMASFNSTEQRAEYASLASQTGLSARKEGDTAKALASGAKTVEAVYEVPYIAHAPMEPLNCAVDLRANSCEIWTGTQFQTFDRMAAAAVAGLKPEQVQLHTTLLGGGFGRRACPASDFVSEAVYVAKAASVPVKVVWTREDDMHGGYYRPAYYHALQGAVDADGYPLAWSHHIVGQSIFTGTPFEKAFLKDGIDPSSVEGAADMAYAIPNISVENHPTRNGVPVLWLRSVGHTHNAWVKECFFDELCALGKKDPFEVRRKLLAKSPRDLGVLELAAAKAGWGKPLPAGRARGIAVNASFESFFAQVAEVSVDAGRVRVHRVVCALDCGTYVNPSIIEAQVQGAIIFALSAALYGELTFDQGRVQQSNFHNYKMVRMNEAPAIEVHIVKSSEKSGGIGEPGVPCLAPAVCNAIFAATGKRMRKLPIRINEAV